MTSIWRKSTYSTSGQNCVEVVWRKSSYSTSGQECVEVAHGERSVGLRDSKNPEGDRLAVTPRAWRSFLATVR
jgi:hypothetical protein